MHIYRNSRQWIFILDFIRVKFYSIFFHVRDIKKKTCVHESAAYLLFRSTKTYIHATVSANNFPLDFILVAL